MSTKKPYEILIRYDHINGNLRGAHVIYAVDGQIGEPQPLDAAGADMQAIIGNTITSMTSQMTAVNTQLNAATTLASQHAQELTNKQVEIDQLKAETEAIRALQKQPTTSVSMVQARLALLRAGLLAQVEAVIKSMPSPERDEARITWEFASAVERSNPLISQLSAVLGMTDEQIDQLFETASTL